MPTGTNELFAYDPAWDKPWIAYKSDKWPRCDSNTTNDPFSTQYIAQPTTSWTGTYTVDDFKMDLGKLQSAIHTTFISPHIVDVGTSCQSLYYSIDQHPQQSRPRINEDGILEKIGDVFDRAMMEGNGES